MYKEEIKELIKKIKDMGVSMKDISLETGIKYERIQNINKGRVKGKKEEGILIMSKYNSILKPDKVDIETIEKDKYYALLESKEELSQEKREQRKELEEALRLNKLLKAKLKKLEEELKELEFNNAKRIK